MKNGEKLNIFYDLLDYNSPLDCSILIQLQIYYINLQKSRQKEIHNCVKQGKRQNHRLDGFINKSSRR
jgi:hypothetical protein